MVHQTYSGQVYRQQDISGASPLHLVLMAYDLAILSCEQGDFVRATQAVSVLRDALNFDYPEAAVGLFRIYQWSLDCIRNGDYPAALSALRELRDAWKTAEKRLVDSDEKQQPLPQPQPRTSNIGTINA